MNRITQSRLKECLEYNQETGEFRWLVSTTRRVMVGDVAGCVRKTDGYVLVRIDCRLYLAHRLAWLYVYGTWPKGMLDHVNRVKRDNRIQNLREATKSENAQNSESCKNNKSGFRGVCWNVHYSKWQAKINLDRKQINLGLFADPKVASDCYEAARERLHPYRPQAQQHSRG